MRLKYAHVVYTVLFLAGVALRIWFATLPYNVDVINYLKDVAIFHRGGNIYLGQPAYNYTPLWFYFLGIIDSIRLSVFPSIPFPVMIRLFLSLVDVMILIVLTRIARMKKIPDIIPLVFYFLNPVSMIISAKHGQFDNVAVLFLILSWVYIQKKEFSAAWLLGTTALLIKHIVLFPFIVMCWGAWGVKKGSVRIAAALMVFLFSFAPYAAAWREIFGHVIFYGGIPGQYGVSYLLTSAYKMFTHTSAVTMQTTIGGTSGNVRMIYIILTMITIVVNVFISLWLTRRKDLWRNMGHSLLFFLASTTGISAQYFMLPTVFFITESVLWVCLYTLVTTFFLLGNADEFALYGFRVWSWNAVWIIIVMWSGVLLKERTKGVDIQKKLVKKSHI